jgi:hypothetical protein
MDIYELAEWAAFWEIEGGFGDLKQDYRIAQVGCILANSNRDRKIRKTPFSIKDFTMRPGAQQNKHKTKEIKARLDALTMVGGK